MLPPKLLSKVDNKSDGDMRCLKFSRGPGSGLIFRKKTPPVLIGTLKLRTEKPFGQEITLGLGTRRLADARDKRDILLGRIKELRNQVQGGAADPRWSIESARGWRADIEKQEREGVGDDEAISEASSTSNWTARANCPVLSVHRKR